VPTAPPQGPADGPPSAGLFLYATDKCLKIRRTFHAQPKRRDPTPENDVLTPVGAEQTPSKNVDFQCFCPLPVPKDRDTLFRDELREVAPHGFDHLQDKAMRSKWFRRIKRFIEQFTPGGTEYTEFGTEIHYTRYGGTSIPSSSVQKLLYMHLDEMEKLRARLKAESNQKEMS
jgi:hypothetical protein